MWVDAPNDSKCSVATTTLGSAVGKPKFSSQSLGKHASSQTHVSPGNAPNPARSKNLRRDVPGRSADRQDVGIEHCPDVEGQVGVIGGQKMSWYSKHCCEELALRVQPRSVCRIEPTEDQFMGGKSTVAQCRVHPAQGRNVVRAVGRSCLKRPHSLRQHARDRLMSAMQ